MVDASPERDDDDEDEDGAARRKDSNDEMANWKASSSFNTFLKFVYDVEEESVNDEADDGVAGLGLDLSLMMAVERLDEMPAFSSSESSSSPYPVFPAFSSSFSPVLSSKIPSPTP